MNKNRKMFIVLLFAFVVCFSLVGCSLQDKIEEYSSDKEQCYLNTENVTQFSYKGNDYTILEDTVSNGGLGEWIGYIRQLAAVDETGKVLLQENIEAATFRMLADLADKAPEAAYTIPFLNVTIRSVILLRLGNKVYVVIKTIPPYADSRIGGSKRFCDLGIVFLLRGS